MTQAFEELALNLLKLINYYTYLCWILLICLNALVCSLVSSMLNSRALSLSLLRALDIICFVVVPHILHCVYRRWIQVNEHYTYTNSSLPLIDFFPALNILPSPALFVHLLTHSLAQARSSCQKEKFK